MNLAMVHVFLLLFIYLMVLTMIFRCHVSTITLDDMTNTQQVDENMTSRQSKEPSIVYIYISLQ